MTPKSYKGKVFNLNDIYEEEVPDTIVEDRKDPEIKVKRSVDIFLLVLFLICVGLLGCTVYYSFTLDKNIWGESTKDGGEIAIVHSKVDFGLTINSFLKHTSEETASKYTFYVENANPNNIEYKVILKEKSIIGKSKVDVSYLQYSLTKNDKKVSSGAISELEKYVLTSQTISKESKDMYILKIWSNTPSNKYYKYQIEVDK